MDTSKLTKNIQPLEIIAKKAKGIRMWDTNDKEYLDFSSQTLNLNLGNSPQIVKKAFLKQFKSFTFLSTRFLNPVLVDLSEKLASISPISPCKINLKLTNGGDANESAFKRVRIYRKKPIIISFYWSHLGESSETLSANGKYASTEMFSGSNNFLHVRTPFELQKRGITLRKAEKLVLTELEVIFSNRNDIAALILEPIMVNAGGYIFRREFLKKIRRLCSTYDISLIFDEIQTGFGWVGSYFISTQLEIIPDILTLGKALASGFPLSAIIMKEEYDLLPYGEDEYTYGGHPVSCAIALENIEYLRSSSLLVKVTKKSRLLQKLLREIKGKFKSLIVDIRIYGLIASVEFINNSIATSVYNESLRNGLILRKSLDGKGESLVLKPPVIVTEEEIRHAIKIFKSSILSSTKETDNATKFEPLS